MRKRGSTSPLDMLALHQKQMLVGWLTTGGKDGVGISYGDAVKRLRSEFGVKTNRASLCNWRARNQRTAGIPESKISRKAVIRSPLDRLPLEVRNTLFTWLTVGGEKGRGMTFAEASIRLRSDFGYNFGVTAIHNFFKRFQRNQVSGVARITTSETGDSKTITIETGCRASVEMTQDADAKTLTLKITLKNES